jgi:hypothetical protein
MTSSRNAIVVDVLARKDGEMVSRACDDEIFLSALYVVYYGTVLLRVQERLD